MHGTELKEALQESVRLEGERFISDRMVEKALDYLRDSAEELGEAAKEARYREHMVKVIKAMEMKKRNESAVNAQERDALITQEYQDAIAADAIATGALVAHKAKREAAIAKIDSWRTMNSNLRGNKLL